MPVLGMRVQTAAAPVTRGLVTGDRERCDAVVAGDDEVDRRELDIKRRLVDLLGRHPPVASDLRMCTAIRHSSFQLDASATWRSRSPWSAKTAGHGEPEGGSH